MKHAARKLLTVTVTAFFILQSYGQRIPSPLPSSPINPAVQGMQHRSMPPMRHHGGGESEPYRGRRMMSGQNEHGNATAFFAERINVKITGQWIILQILFSLPLDPYSVNTDIICLNGKELGAQTVVKFGRMGNLLQLLVPVQHTANAENADQVFDLLLTGITGYNGIPLEDRHYNGIRCDRVYVFTE